MLFRSGKTISVKGKGGLGGAKNWLGVGIMVVVFLAYGLMNSGINVNRFLNGLGGGGNTLLTIGMAAVAVLMILHTVRRIGNGDGISMIPRILACVGSVGGLILLIRGTAEDMAFYAVSLGMLGAAIWELGMINRAHNEYASRPVPFFGEKGEER